MTGGQEPPSERNFQRNIILELHYHLLRNPRDAKKQEMSE